MAAKRLTPTSGIPVPPVPPVPVVPGLPGLTPPTTTVPPTTPKTTGPTRTTSNKVKTRLGTVEMEQLAGDPATRLKTEGRAIRDLIVNAPVGFTQFVVGAGIDIGKGALEVGSKLIPGVNFEAGRFRTTEDLISSFGRTGQFLGRALNPVRMAGAAIDPRNPKYDPLPPHYMEALEKNQSILPFIIEDFGNISMAGSIYSGVAKGAIRGVTLGEAAARAERTAASNAMASAAAGSAEAAEAAARMAKADAQLARIARTKDVLGKQADIGRNIARQADRVGALPFKPYTYTTRKLLGLYRDGIYLGPDGRYARWGQKASEGYAEQAQRLVDEGVSMDDERVVNLMNKSVKAGRRSVAREVMKQVRAATRDAENEQGSAVRAVTSQMMDPLHKDVIDPETNQPYGELSLDEAAAVLAVIGGNAQIINRLAARYNISPRVLALMGRYDFKEEYSLSQRAAEMARDFMNYSPENPGTLTPERYERLADAADKVSNVVFKAMIERAAAGYGRRNALDPAYMVPTPFVERLERNILESIKQAEKALRKERSKKTPNAAEVSRLEIILNDRYALYEAWGEVKEAGIFELPVDHPDRIATLKGFVDQLPIELALDPTMYPASMRVPLEFYRRIRRAMAAKIIGDEGGPEPVGPDGEPTGPRLTPARSTREGAVEAELAKRERSKEAIERKIKQTAEQIDKLEVQHAKLVERILRYDVVDAYIGGASLIQIIGDFKLDGNLVRKILENSPVARTYRRLQNIRTRLAEIESQVGSANIDQIDAIMAQADRLNQEATAAQAEYDRVAALAEAERQQIEAEADALNEELYDLEEGMGDYEGQYEDAGGVVDDIYEDDGTIVIEDGETLQPTKKRDVSEETGLVHPMDALEDAVGSQLEEIRELRQKNEDQRNSRKKNKEYVNVPEPEIDLSLQPVDKAYDVKGYVFLSGQDRMNTSDSFEIIVRGLTPDLGSVGVSAIIYTNYAVNKFDQVLEDIDYAIEELNKVAKREWDETSFTTMANNVTANWAGSTLNFFDTDYTAVNLLDEIEKNGLDTTPELFGQIIRALNELKAQILKVGENPQDATPAKLTPPPAEAKSDIESVNNVFEAYEIPKTSPVAKLANHVFGDQVVETDPAKITKSRIAYIEKAIKSGKNFYIYSTKAGSHYFSDGFIIIPISATYFQEKMLPYAKSSGMYIYGGKKGDKIDPVNVELRSKETVVPQLMKKYFDSKGKPLEKHEPLSFLENDSIDGIAVVVLQTADGSKVFLNNDIAKQLGAAEFFSTGENKPVIFKLETGRYGLIMPVRADNFAGKTKVDRFISSLEKMKLTPSKIGGKSVSNFISEIRNSLGKPKEIAVTYQPGYEPKPKPLTPKKPKATKPSEVKPDDNIVDPVVREAVYTKEVVDAMAADAAAKMDAAQTFNEKIKAFQEFLDLSKKYDAEMARMAIELESSRNARAKKKKIEEKIAKLRAALEELPEQAEAAGAAVEAMLTNPFYDAYMNMDGSTPLDVALEGGYPSEIGGFEIESPGGENVRLIGPMYYPSGVPKEFFGGIETEVTREGFTGYEKLSSEHYRDGDRQVIFSLRELAIRMGRQVRQMAMNDKFRALVSQFGKSASEILGEEYTQGLYEQAVAYVDNMPIDALRVHVAEKISESLKTDMPISGIASPGPGVKNQKAVREFAINFEFGRLIGEAMRARGYEAIDPYAKIKDVIPAQNITARRAGETVADVDMDGPFDDPAPDDIVPETMFLPKGIKEKMAQVVSTKNEGAFEKAMRGAQKVTSFFKVGTLALSIPWQIGDLTSSMIIATMSGVDPRTLIKYMKEIKIQEYGEGPGSLRRMVDPNADWTNFRRGPLARLAGESGVQNLGQTLQERSYLYGEDLRPERGVVDRLSGGRLKFVSDAAAAVTGVSFKINETINKIVRHAFFLEQLDIQLRQRGQTLESLKNVENWQNDSKLREAVFDAARSANQWLGDYANLSVRERKYMGPLIPFWSWIRHIHGVFDLVAVNNPEALFYYMYLGTLADAEDDPLGLRRGGFNVFGGVASSNWLNPFADVVAGPIGSALLEQDLRPAGGSLGPVPRLLGGAVGYDVSRFGLIRRPSGTGGYSESGEQTSRSVLPLIGGSVSETAGFTAQQFPIAQRLLNLNPTPFENIPGTRIALGPVARFQTGEARLSSTTGRRIEQPGGRLASALRMFGGPLVPYRTDEQIAEVLAAARQKLITLDEIQRQRELQGAP